MSADRIDGTYLDHWAAELGLVDLLARAVGAWRQRLRLVAALRLLAAGRTTTEVAPAVGYSTPSAFAAMFRTTMHTTPRRWADARPARRG